MSECLFYATVELSFGSIGIAVDEEGVLVELWLPNRGPRIAPSRTPPRGASDGAREVAEQLTDYANGRRRSFDLRAAPRGSPFEQRVWGRLCEIPYGCTTSYGAIAEELGLTNGARAVGRANGANPIPIVIPCHRVIGTDGKLTGYGGGLPLKRTLLELEGAIPPPAPRLL